MKHYLADSLIQTLPSLSKINVIRVSDGGLDIVETEVKPKSFIRDGFLYISTEHDDNAGDYYGESRGGCSWVNPKLEDWAARHGTYWEWLDCGTIVLAQ